MHVLLQVFSPQNLIPQNLIPQNTSILSSEKKICQVNFLHFSAPGSSETVGMLERFSCASAAVREPQI